jgi:hypothetical protein
MIYYSEFDEEDDCCWCTIIGSWKFDTYFRVGIIFNTLWEEYFDYFDEDFFDFWDFESEHVREYLCEYVFDWEDICELMGEVTRISYKSSFSSVIIVYFWSNYFYSIYFYSNSFILLYFYSNSFILFY